MSVKTWFQQNLTEFTGEVRWDEPMSKHTYYKIGGPADVFLIPKTLEDLKWIRRGLFETSAPSFVLGLGSNLLVADSGFSGVVVKCGKMNLELEEVQGRVRVGASVPVSTLLRKAMQQGWGGLEFLTGIPGSMGGVVVMNGGTHLGETKDMLEAVEYFDFHDEYSELIRTEGANLKYAYRANLYLPSQAVVWAGEFRLKRENPEKVKTLIEETLTRRKSTQPIDVPSCGSVFKNPKEHGMHAWQVIEKLGLRGHAVGGAKFSEMHANFLVNFSNAKASDVKSLIDLAKTRAKKELGIELQEEVKYLGFK